MKAAATSARPAYAATETTWVEAAPSTTLAVGVAAESVEPASSEDPEPLEESDPESDPDPALPVEVGDAVSLDPPLEEPSVGSALVSDVAEGDVREEEIVVALEEESERESEEVFVPVAEAVAEVPVAEPVGFEVAEETADEEEEEESSSSSTPSQLRSNIGVVERSLETANFISLSGLESRRLYQKVGVLLKSFLQPMSCQYFLALATLETASSQSGPVAGQPVSVTQTGLPAAAAIVASYARPKSLPAFSMLLPLPFS